ncbi:transmembrane amino acid transporter protein-domain-containing protein [Lineolata rhizophorae]|uniref:Transmembrane amino acid transporter protein-domain-containing protein n=1 Tax=Lineolata rhizophorae TaxID=578093 RepID=A0A6A6NNU2_9PEZI|nr:transmembrane amino acid transporter protein-domain-containing protein [Lineolata rhizophorae]
MFSEGGKNYRTLGRWDTAIILITNEVGLGILSLPAALQTLGVVPGVIAIIGIGLLSTYTAYELLQYYRRYPFCVNIVDMAKVLGGLPLEIATGIGLLIKLCLTCASAGITMSIALNSMSDHGMCTVAFIAFPMIGCWLLCLPRTFKFVSQVGIPSTISIVSAILIVMISLGVSDPQNAPPGFEVEIAAVGHPGFKDGFTSCLNIAYAYAGNVGFVSIMAEQRDPSRDFLPALWILQCFAITLYVVVAVTVYCLAGQYTTSPSLGSAPLIPAKVAYGIVFPALLATGLCFGHTALKYLYVVCMRGLKSTNEVTANTVKSWSVWVGVTTIFWVVAFILANAIPIFSSILSISSATFIAWFTFGLSAVFWFHLNWGNLFMNWKKICLTIVNTLIIMIALFMNSAGLWAAITGLMETYEDNSNEISGAFTCADNGIL